MLLLPDLAGGGSGIMDGTQSILASDDVEADYPAAAEPLADAPPRIGTDERRMHVRAYRFWVSLLRGRRFPALDDLDPAAVPDFGDNSLLLDFRGDPANPRIRFMGAGLRDEAAGAGSFETLADVPAAAIVARICERCAEMIADQAPTGVEAEFVNRSGGTTLYRGILMPFSSGGRTPDHVYAVVNWKEVADAVTTTRLTDEVERALSELPRAIRSDAIWADGPNAAPRTLADLILPETDFSFTGIDPANDQAGDPRVRLRRAPSRGSILLEEREEEFVLLLARRAAGGRLDVLAPVRDDSDLLDRAFRGVAL